MARIQLSERELKRVRDYNYKWNPNGFALMEFGTQYDDHIRLDLTPFENKSKRQYSGGEYNYLICEFHVKMEVGRRQYAYAFFNYSGGGIWTRYKSMFKDGDRNRGQLNDHHLNMCINEARLFLRALREVTKDMDQMLAMYAPPEMMRGLA